MTKKLPSELKQTRKSIQTACEFCHTKHIQCDVGRPCQNCLKRNIGKFCRDKKRKSRKRIEKHGTQPYLNLGKRLVIHDVPSKTVSPSSVHLQRDFLSSDQEKPGKTPAHNTNIQYTYNINDNFQSAGSIPRITNFNTNNGQTVLENTSNNISASQAVHLMNDPIIPTVRKSTLNLKSHFLEQHKAMQQPLATNCLVATSNVPVHSGMDDSNKSDDDVDDETNIHFDSMWCNDEYMKLKDIVDISTPFLPNNSQIFSLQESEYPNPSASTRGNSSLHLTNLLNSTKSVNDQKDSSIGHSTSTFNTYDEVVSRPFISLDMLHLNRGANANTQPSHNAKLESECDSSSHSDADLEKHDTDFISPSKFRELVKTPQDLYDNKCLIKLHNYKLAYTKLLTTLRKKFLEGAEIDKSASVKDEHSTQKHNLRYDLEVIIRSILERYAPIFISLTSNMIEEDLLLQEVTLQRALLDLENMAKLVSCTPMCIWRRSGEICFVSNEFYSLTGFNKNLLLDRTSFIFEYLDHKSVSNYFQIFNELLAFGYNDINKRKKLLMLNACSSTSSKITEGFSFTTDGKAIFTKCNLLLSNGLYLKCACCWTVKRDSFNIPILVMGQFLPIFEMD
ncbi:APG_G0029130.mRNA.1.CDS.1 [Saccharomyces cerevisiae]|uniref:Glucose starvation modulator protein 1 n=1 Tax=Saccharomyces cerevisiae (strain JAY291) TaxID=574961 RepID=GSM1_YEAS2|nr:RecName: Full=Glucose starvation modulator protein 1 [Saccharomyces cerevisiae JAY291]AJR67810.1 Gsm1p [Saccharomyces cerevisiae YJM1250]CAE6498463.1 Gsm1p [Saccharomyces cerevisiae PE-2]CAI4563407.1 APG_G0029130.mRNA.1.CDS.1 [Saccharomyces cerevisiae]EEU06736.1 YJL103C-like protein [Saccharomyces cerevisiae JAY291]CAF1584508.1 Gsm1p [Saccharomyces cerevisiae PE-2]